MAGRNLLNELEVADQPRGRNLLAELSQPPAKRPTSFLPSGVAEYAGNAVRSVTEGIDFITTNAVNAVPAMMGSDFRIPTLTGAVEAMGGGQTGFMEPGLARDITQAAGRWSPAGLGILAAAKGIPPLLSRETAQNVGDLVRQGRRGAEDIVQKAKIRAGDADMVNRPVTETGEVVTDKLAKAAVRQHFDPGVVSMVRASTPETRQGMRQMVDIYDAGQRNARYAADNRPADVVGDAISGRIVAVRDINRQAGKKLDQEARILKGQQIDIADAKTAFLAAMDELGVGVDEAGKLVIQGSQLQLTGTAPLQEIFRRVNNFSGDAYEAHQLKRFISTQVNFGKKNQNPKNALADEAERALKGLRHNIDALLDAKSTGYKEANDVYSETIDVLNRYQKAVGNIDLFGRDAEKAIGQSSRRYMGNMQSRVPMKVALEDLGELTVRENYPAWVKRPESAKFKDDIKALAIFADEIDKVFKPAGRTSFASEVAMSRRQVNEIPTTAFEAGAKSGAWAWNKMRNVNEDEALRSIRALLER